MLNHSSSFLVSSILINMTVLSITVHAIAAMLLYWVHMGLFSQNSPPRNHSSAPYAHGIFLHGLVFPHKFDKSWVGT